MVRLRSSAGRVALACALGAVLGVAGADEVHAAGTLESRVMVLPSEGEPPGSLAGLATELSEALARGAKRTTPTVAQAAASLADTAVVVGCDPADPACLDAVAAALNVDQLLIVRITTTDAGAAVEVTALTREAVPVTRTFQVRPGSRKDDVAAIEAAVPTMLEAGEAQIRASGDGGPAGGGAETGDEARGPGPVVGPEDPIDQPRPVGPLMVAGGGGAAVLAGGVFWALASGAQGDIDAAPTETAADLDHLADLEASARTRATVGNVLVIGGGVALAAGAVWWFTTRSGGAVTVAPAASLDGAGVVVGGRW